MEFQDNFKKLRTQGGLTQAELAEALGTTKSLVSMWESGKRKPSFEMLESIADYFNVNMDVLMGESQMSFQEAELLNLYRMASADTQAAILAFARAMINR